MPKGSKKRKAAKRKMEMGIHPDSPTSPQGNGRRDDEDLTSHDGKESEGGEVETHHLTDEEGEEEKKMDSSGLGEVEDRSVEVLENGGRKDEGLPVPQKLEEFDNTLSELDKKEVVVEEVPYPTLHPSEIPVSEPEVVGVEFVLTEKGKDDRGLEEEPRIVECPKELEKDEEHGGDGCLKGTKASQEVSEESAEQFVSVTEVAVAHANEAPVVNYEAIVAIDSSAHESEVKVVPVLDTASEQPRECCTEERSSEIAVTTEVARAPLAAHHASWLNCCGLFDVLTSSQK